MLFEYFIFKILPDGARLWIGDAQNLEEAKNRISCLVQRSPGAYSVYNIRNRTAPVFEWKSDTQPGAGCSSESVPRDLRNLRLVEAYLRDLARITRHAGEEELIAQALASVQRVLQSDQDRSAAAGTS
jgi:hypothetical protein